VRVLGLVRGWEQGDNLLLLMVCVHVHSSAQPSSSTSADPPNQGTDTPPPPPAHELLAAAGCKHHILHGGLVPLELLPAHEYEGAEGVGG